MSKRRKAREMALQMLYQSDVGSANWAQVQGHFSAAEYSLIDPDPIDPAYVLEKTAMEQPAVDVAELSLEESDEPDEESLRGKRLEDATDYARRLASGTLEKRSELDELIRQRADNWRIERMPPVDRNILRLAVYELKYETDVPRLVVVDEAIELGKRFGSEKSGKFINGVLDGLLSLETVGGSSD